jgi:hypothetical protein
VRAVTKLAVAAEEQGFVASNGEIEDGEVVVIYPLHDDAIQAQHQRR